MIFIAVAVVGGISAKSLITFNNLHSTIKKSQASDIKDVTVGIQNEEASDDNTDSNLLSDATNLSENSETSQDNNDNTNKQETISTKLEKSSNNINKQETISPKSEKASNNNEIDNQEIVSSKPEKVNNNNATNKQEIIASKSETSSNNTNKQESTSSKLEISNNNDTNKQSANNSQLKEVTTENNANTNTTLDVKIPTIHYDRTTSIYANDNITLLRVEYYANNKLTYYSVVEQFDAETKSYIEKIYKCNRETNIDPLIRTDVYANGNLIKSY